MLKDILSVSGHSGLYKLVSHGKNNMIVESLIDGKRIPAYASSRVSGLEEISIYTEDGDTKLTDVLILIFENKIEVNPKAPDKILKETFRQILPNYDPDKVYVSHIKKIFAWYNILTEKEILTEETIKNYKETLEEEEAQAEAETEEKDNAEAETEEKEKDEVENQE